MTIICKNAKLKRDYLGPLLGKFSMYKVSAWDLLFQFSWHWPFKWVMMVSWLLEKLRNKTTNGFFSFSEPIRMQHWRPKATDGAEFWISCKRPAFLSTFSRLQMIQNKRPWCCGAAYVTAGLQKTKTISCSVFSSQILQNTEIIIVVHWNFWRKYGSVLHLFSCTAGFIQR